MAYTTADFPFPSREKHFGRTWGGLAGPFEALRTRLRKRRIYQRTLRDLQGYSQRHLADFGANHGIEEFARRAAGL